MLSLFMSFFNNLLDYFMEFFTQIDNMGNTQKIARKAPKPPKSFKGLELIFN